MLLAMDVGNTNVTVGVYRGDGLLHQFRIATRRESTADEYGILLKGLLAQADAALTDVRAAALCSVVPPLNSTLTAMCRKYLGLEPEVIGPESDTGLHLLCDDPSELGMDRVVDAVAAYHQYGGPAVVVDMGTATSFGAITAAGEFLGGAIAPGIGIAAEALFQRAAKLPRIDLVRPGGSVIGKNTVASMQAGIVYGYVGAVDAVVDRIRREMGTPDAKVIATGGLAPLVAGLSKTIQTLDPHLTLTGLWVVHQRASATRPPA